MSCAASARAFPAYARWSDVSFAIWPGEMHMLLGENGAGKSTLMKVLCGAIAPTSGEVYLRGPAVVDRFARRRAPARHRGDLPGILAGSLSRHRAEHLLGRAPRGRAARHRSTASVSTPTRDACSTSIGFDIDPRESVHVWASPSSRWSRSPRRCRRTRASW